jgi:hypothetical protein
MIPWLAAHLAACQTAVVGHADPIFGAKGVAVMHTEPQWDLIPLKERQEYANHAVCRRRDGRRTV